MKKFVGRAAGQDAYVLDKFGQLQEAARDAKADLEAIPQNATVDEEFDEIRFALALVERRARMLAMAQASTTQGRAALSRAEAWLSHGELGHLLEPLEMAA